MRRAADQHSVKLPITASILAVFTAAAATPNWSERYICGGNNDHARPSVGTHRNWVIHLSADLAWPQQNAPSQSPPERHDSATSGAGPTSGAPGLHPNDPPKGSSVTIDSSGVATVQPTQRPAQTDAPLDRGNESAGAAPGK
jgi:hypothetical protein